MENQEIIKTLVKDGAATVTILTGSAPEQHNNKCVSIQGNIDAPSRFIQARKKDFEGIARHCLVSETEGKIELVINPQSSTDKHTIVGKIEVSKKFKALGINNSSESYLPERLHQKLKMMRSYFPDKSAHTALCKELKNLTATIQREIEDHDDERGNVSQKFRQTVESNIPSEFIMSLPLIEGEPPQDISMAINLVAGGTSTILCYLQSMDAADLIEETFKKRIDEEVEKLQEHTVIITY
jgi:hypothetical protein